MRGRAAWLAPPAVALALLAAGGCAGERQVAEDATVTVYAAAERCGAAQRALRSSGHPSSLRLRLACLPSVRRGGRLALAQIGVNARRAVEDSTTVAYIGEADGAATRFSETILEEGDVAQLSGMGGAEAMRRLLGALERADLEAGGLREQVRDDLGS